MSMASTLSQAQGMLGKVMSNCVAGEAAEGEGRGRGGGAERGGGNHTGLHSSSQRAVPSSTVHAGPWLCPRAGPVPAASTARLTLMSIFSPRDVSTDNSCSEVVDK